MAQIAILGGLILGVFVLSIFWDSAHLVLAAMALMCIFQVGIAVYGVLAVLVSGVGTYLTIDGLATDLLQGQAVVLGAWVLYAPLRKVYKKVLPG
jgi:hypothetical protein